MKTNLKMMAEIKKRRKRRARNIIPTLEKSNYLLLENANKILKAKVKSKTIIELIKESLTQKYY